MFLAQPIGVSLQTTPPQRQEDRGTEINILEQVRLQSQHTDIKQKLTVFVRFYSA